MADTAIGTADDLVERLDGMITQQHIARIMQKQHGNASSDSKLTRKREDENYNAVGRLFCFMMINK